MVLNPQSDSGPEKDNAGPALPSIDDAIAAAMGGEEVKAGSDIKEPEVKEPAKAETPKPDKIAGDKAADEDATPPAKDAKAEEPKAADDKPEGDASKPLEAPKHWPAERTKAFNGLPDDAKRHMLALAKDLEGGFTRKSQELGDKAKFADAVKGLFDDRTRQALAQKGSDEVGFIQYLTNLQRFSADRPADYIVYAMKQLGVRPEHLGLSPPQQQQPAQQQPTPEEEEELYVDPAVKALRAELADLKKWKGEREAHEANQVRQRDEADRTQRTQQVQSLQRTVGEFRAALDDHGQLKFPHFDAVQRQMGALMDTDPEIAALADGPAKLEAAYDRAVWARPDLRASLLDQEKAKAAADAERRANATKARTAVAVRPSSGVPAERIRATSLDDAITGAMSRAGL